MAQGTTPGLEFTTWGYLIKDNVWMRDDATVDANRPNFLIDAAPMSGPGIDDIATIEGNVVLGNATNAFVEAGFQLAGNLIVRNNIIMHIEGDGYAGIRIAHPPRASRCAAWSWSTIPCSCWAARRGRGV